MTCSQLGGACDVVFSAETFDELGAQSQQPGKEMFSLGEPAHMAAMGKMMEMDAGAMATWMAARRGEFERS